MGPHTLQLLPNVHHAPAGYVFCCSGVFIYQWLKYQDAARTPTNTPVGSLLPKTASNTSAASAKLLASSRSGRSSPEDSAALIKAGGEESGDGGALGKEARSRR